MEGSEEKALTLSCLPPPTAPALCVCGGGVPRVGGGAGLMAESEGLRGCWGACLTCSSGPTPERPVLESPS